MKKAILVLVYLFLRSATLLKPGGVRTILAENMLLKHQLLLLQRSRRRAPNLRPTDPLLFGFWALFLTPRRLLPAAIVLKPSTLLRLVFDEVLVMIKPNGQ